jgi:hypothetical protein
VATGANQRERGNRGRKCSCLFSNSEHFIPLELNKTTIGLPDSDAIPVTDRTARTNS